jgi:uncharacterized integral membrane protein
MSEDPTRATPLARDVPAHGNVGPSDPHADPLTQPGLRRPASSELDGPVTDPSMRAVPTSPEQPTVPTSTRPSAPVVVRTRTGGLWTGLILSAIVLIFLLVFILQNLNVVTIFFLGFTFSLPVGVALLLAAVAGLLLVAIPGGLRILQLRRAARRASVR